MTASPTYYDIIRSHGHAAIAALPSYATLRQALSDIGSEAAESGGIRLGEFLGALRDMAATAPFGDVCDECWRDHRHGDSEPHGSCVAGLICWPHAIRRHGESVTGTYRCQNGHAWTCTNLINIIGM